ncbi:hypothetical protein POTOM_020612 [Populus tomentosa]|uniref:Uncharacterized protein n=1 Tax=Populus tomentosa TaxID=118781 RepID=A0A8X7ZPP4_POPTO|nr:hypothetical protein POTOM_020612 [Populus tomentosa]
MATASLIESSPLKWKQAFPFQPQPPLLTPNHYPYLVPLKPPKFTSKCISQLPILNPNSKNNNGPFPISPSITKPISQNLSKPPTSKNPLEIIYETMLKALDILKKPAIAAILIGVLLLHDPNSAFAASGGRIGGNSFSRRSSSEYSSRSYSVPRGFAAFMLVSGFLSDRNEGGVLTAAEKTTVLKLQVGLLGMGRSLQRDLNRIAEVADTSSSEGLNYVLTVCQGMLGQKGMEVSELLMGTEDILHMRLMLTFQAREDMTRKLIMRKINETHFVELAQLDGYSALKQKKYRIQSRLEIFALLFFWIGFISSLTYPSQQPETSLALLRHPDYCISGYSFVDVKRSMEDGEKRFNQLSIEERGKFDEETLVNVNSIKRQSTSSKRSNGFSNEYIVITILVAAEGVYKLPTINGSGDLKEALQKLGSIPASKILAVEVLWTPQNENDTLSERELLEDYPLLRPL